MKIDDQIAVMNAYKDGKTIEARNLNSDIWRVELKPSWNWAKKEYRKYRSTEDPFSYKGMKIRIDKTDRGHIIVSQNVFDMMDRGTSIVVTVESIREKLK